MKETILVTGGAGFIGSHTCEALLKEDYTVLCVDNLNNYYNPSIKRQNLKILKKFSQSAIAQAKMGMAPKYRLEGNSYKSEN